MKKNFICLIKKTAYLPGLLLGTAITVCYAMIVLTGWEDYQLNRSLGQILLHYFPSAVLLLFLSALIYPPYSRLLKKKVVFSQQKIPCVRRVFSMENIIWALSLAFIFFLDFTDLFPFPTDIFIIDLLFAAGLVMIFPVVFLRQVSAVCGFGKQTWFPESLLFAASQLLHTVGEEEPIAAQRYILLVCAAASVAVGLVLRLMLRRSGRKTEAEDVNSLTSSDKVSRKKRIGRYGGLYAGGIALTGLVIWLCPAIRNGVVPIRDAEGYYLIGNKTGFDWFLTEAEENDELNIRLTADIALNEERGGEHWIEAPPENRYASVLSYNGSFDGNGYSLYGYCSSEESPVFCILGEDAVIKNLAIKDSCFYTTYENGTFWDEEEGAKYFYWTCALSLSNHGTIENCTVQAEVSGAGQAGGLVGINKGVLKDCSFTGKLTAGRSVQEPDTGEENWGISIWKAGGICGYNKGFLTGCVNEGDVTLLAVQGSGNSVCGGITGYNGPDGEIEDCENFGYVQSTQLAGGIAGTNVGRIENCNNTGRAHVEPKEIGYVQYLLTAGICPSNGGLIDQCGNSGEVTINPSCNSFWNPIYAIGNSECNPGKGLITNCGYLNGSVVQDYRQSGVYRLCAEEMEKFRKDPDWIRSIEDRDSRELFSKLPDIPGTGKEDYIRLAMGPDEDILVTVRPNDSLWEIAERFYGDGSQYPLLERTGGGNPDILSVGEEVIVPHLDFYLLRANDELGFDLAQWGHPDGSRLPVRYLAAHPGDWYHGGTDADRELSVLWPKYDADGATYGDDRELPYEGVRIFYNITGNPDGDFWAKDWAAVRQSIRESAQSYCGDNVTGLRFYRYELDSGDNLYGFSFLLHRKNEVLRCTAFYRLRSHVLAEFIGIEPYVKGNETLPEGARYETLLEEVRYLAAAVDQEEQYEGAEESDGESFLGRDNWKYQRLHNPFAIAQTYSIDEENFPYMLFTGAQ